MAQRICFLGRGGSGKSTVAQNLSHALALKGYRVLLVGNDISLSSTLLLRGEADISPALEDYREHYEIDLSDYVLPTASGVYCLELGSIDPGAGCLVKIIYANRQSFHCRHQPAFKPPNTQKSNVLLLMLV